MSLQRFFSPKYLAPLGFLSALIPLLMAAVYAAFAVEETAALGQKAIYQVLNQAKTGQLVTQRVKAVERKAKYFTLLSTPALRDPYERESYESVRESLRQSLDQLQQLNVGQEIDVQIKRLREQEQQIYQAIVGSETDNHFSVPGDAAFRSLHTLASDLRHLIAEGFDREVSELQDQSQSVQQTLLTKISILLPTSLVLIVVLVVVFDRAIRQLDASIRRLGTGDFVESIAVTGPEDFRHLGDRLEWLRTRRLALEESKQEFMRNFSAEVKMPLTTIQKGSALLASGALGELHSAQRDVANRLAGGIERLQTLIGDIIRYSQFNAASLKRPKQAVNMQELVKSMTKEYQGRLQAKALRIRTLLQPVEVLGVREQLQTVIDNLLSNAVKFSPMGGEILVILRAAGANMELEVEDDGPGIEGDERLNVFEPFFRGKAASAAAPQGSGLGLAIASECVANHQGKIEIVEPRQDKQGTRVRVQIPLAEAI